MARLRKVKRHIAPAFIQTKLFMITARRQSAIKEHPKYKCTINIIIINSCLIKREFKREKYTEVHQ